MRLKSLAIICGLIASFGLACFGQLDLPLYWEVHWYKVIWTGNSVIFDREIGIDFFPICFEKNWGDGAVYKNVADLIGFKAYLELYVPVTVLLQFRIDGDDGFALHIDNQPVSTSRWDVRHPLSAEERPSRLLSAGIHKLELHYFERYGKAWIKFNVENFNELILAGLVDKLQARVQELLALSTQTQKEIAELHGQLQIVDEVFRPIRAAQDTVVQAIQSLAKQVEELVQKLTGVESGVTENLDELASKVYELSETTAELQTQVQELLALRKKIPEEIGALHSQLQAFQEEVGQIRAVQEDVLKIVDSLAKQIEELAQTLSRIENAVTKNLDELSNKISELSETTAKLQEPTGSWEVHWYELVEPGVFGRELGTSSFPFVFSFNWSYGIVFNKYWDRVGFKAYALIFVPKDSWGFFKVSANNCFALYIDDVKVMDHWGVGEALAADEQSIEYFLSAGFHKLELHYYEWDGPAWVSFYFH